MNIPWVLHSQCLARSDSPSLTELARALLKMQPDVVALTGLHGTEDCARLLAQLRDLYPHHLEGPHEAAVPLTDAEVAGGGLLLLSRLPFAATHQTIYRHFSGADALANKGALHAVVEPRGWPCGLDLFVTDTQTAAAAGESSAEAREACRAQLAHLATFMQSLRDPMRPALLAGDLHVDAHGKPSLNDVLPFTPGRALDLSPVSAPKPPGCLLGFDGLHYLPEWSESRATGAAGIVLAMSGIGRRAPPAPAPLARICVSLRGVRCLQTTARPGDDEVEFELTAACGTTRLALHTGRLEDMGPGCERRLALPELVIEGPHDALMLTGTGHEHDDIADDEGLGSSTLVLGRDELVTLRGAPLVRAMPLLTGGGAEYALRIEVRVE